MLNTENKNMFLYFKLKMFSVAKTTFVLNENTATQGKHLIRKE